MYLNDLYNDIYHDLCTLLLADVFETFRKICLKIYNLDSVKFLSTPGIASQAALKISDAKLELLTDIAML